MSPTEQQTELSTENWTDLHEIRLRGMIAAGDDDRFGELLNAGYVAVRGPNVVITPAGKAAHAAWARLPEGSEEEAAARSAYTLFLDLDKAVKRVTADWQLAAANARPDGYSAEDWGLIDRLTAVHEKAGAMLLRLGRAVPRFAGYRPRFRHALAQLEEGDRQWFSGLKLDSYHTLWWHLHEDLLLAIGVSRSEDPNQ